MKGLLYFCLSLRLPPLWSPSLWDRCNNKRFLCRMDKWKVKGKTPSIWLVNRVYLVCKVSSSLQASFVLEHPALGTQFSTLSTTHVLAGDEQRKNRLEHSLPIQNKPTPPLGLGKSGTLSIFTCSSLFFLFVHPLPFWEPASGRGRCARTC